MGIESVKGFFGSLFFPKVIEEIPMEQTQKEREEPVFETSKLQHAEAVACLVRAGIQVVHTILPSLPETDFNKVITEASQENMEKISQLKLWDGIRAGEVDVEKYQQMLSDLFHVYMSLENAEELLSTTPVSHCVIQELKRAGALAEDCETWNASHLLYSSKAEKFGDQIIQTAHNQREMVIAYMHVLYSFPLHMGLDVISALSQEGSIEFYLFDKETNASQCFSEAFKIAGKQITGFSLFGGTFNDLLQYHAREASLKLLRLLESIEKE